MGKPQIYAIVGPTASGKTATAIELARKKKTEIVSFDSRQLYRELSVGVARPSEEELAMCKHYGIADSSIHQPLSAGEFARVYRPLVKEIIELTGSVVLVGGTGLYLKHLLYTLDDLPIVEDSLRESINLIYQSDGLLGLQQRLEALDPKAHLLVDWQNPARLKRAIELCSGSGKSLHEIYSGQNNPYFCETGITIWGLDWNRNELYNRIDQRVDAMMLGGLLNEVQTLVSFSDLPVLKTVGYSELFQFLTGEITLPQAVEKIKQHTRNYAKRQITYFRHQFPTQWVTPAEILDLV